MAYDPSKAKDGRMAHEGGSWAMHHENLHDETGIKRELPPSEDIHVWSEDELSRLGHAALPDAADVWLAQYEERERRKAKNGKRK